MTAKNPRLKHRAFIWRPGDPITADVRADRVTLDLTDPQDPTRPIHVYLAANEARYLAIALANRADMVRESQERKTPTS